MALNRLAKWRMVFAGWQLGTRAKGDPESDAVRDHREATLLMRAEMNAIARILFEKKILSHEEYDAVLEQEAQALSKYYERFFPGVTATDEGVKIDLQRASEWMKNWRP